MLLIEGLVGLGLSCPSLICSLPAEYIESGLVEIECTVLLGFHMGLDGTNEPNVVPKTLTSKVLMLTMT